MILTSENGNRFELRVVGYQFPEAADPAKRFSWHEVSGAATSKDGTWTFEWPALRCAESAQVSLWLREVAGVTGERPAPARLSFLEPNLRFDAEVSDGPTSVTVTLDQEFLPPWKTLGSGGGFRVVLHDVGPQLLAAADEWDADLVSYPDGRA